MDFDPGATMRSVALRRLFVFPVFAGDEASLVPVSAMLFEPGATVRFRSR